MKTVAINGKKYKVYDSIDELPIINFQKYNKFLLIDSGVGSDVEDVSKHIGRLAKYIKSDTKKAMVELQNMHQNLMFIMHEISPKYMAFAALIHSINDKPVSDLSDENLKNIIKDLHGVRHSWLVDFIYSLKKKFRPS